MPYTILLVDDILTCREPIAACLRLAGYRVVCAADGRQALDLLEDCSPDLVLLDMAMPRKTGLEFLQEIREVPQWRDLPVILFTGSGDVLRKLGYELQVEECLVKSQVTPAQIRDAIHRAICGGSRVAA